jgi:hypothetical protein
MAVRQWLGAGVALQGGQLKYHPDAPLAPIIPAACKLSTSHLSCLVHAKHNNQHI